MHARARGIEERAQDEAYFAGAPPAEWRRDELGESEAWPSLAERFEAQLLPFQEGELAAAREPHPHAFQQDECGMFPIGEVSVIAAPGREGKTFATISLAVSYCLGTKIVGLTPQAERSVIIYSAEDDRPQYARKVLAQISQLGRADAAQVLERVIVPDLTAPGMDLFTTLVSVVERQPIDSPAVAGIIQALRPAMERPLPPGLIVFETASTLSDAEEDNRSFKAMIKALRRIARELKVAVVLVHHTSQQAASNLPDLNLSVADIRGATALAFNARQCFLLVNLGSEEDPLPDSDARAVLRSMVAPSADGRVTALICLDSSKAMDPPPVFFKWGVTPAGPALRSLAIPSDLQGVRWRKLQQMLRGERADRKHEAKEEARSATMRQVVQLVARLESQGRQPTATAISVAANRSAGWSKQYLDYAVEAGELVQSMERVLRAKGACAVYRLPDSSGVAP